MISNFDAATKLMKRDELKNLSLRDRKNLFFIDYSLIPLLFQENYLNSIHKTDTNTLENLVKATNSIAEGEIMSKSIRTNQEWKLLDAFGFKSTIYPGELLCQGIGFAQFPEWFGKNSTTRKIYREVRELSMALMGSITGTRNAVQHDYAPALMRLIDYHMRKGGSGDLEEVLQIYEQYDLTPELVKEHLLEIIYNPEKIDFMQNVEKKSKANMTKLYNQKWKSSLVAKKRKAVREPSEERMFDDDDGERDVPSDTPSDSEEVEIVQVGSKVGGKKKGAGKQANAKKAPAKKKK